MESGHGAIDEPENYWGKGRGDQETREEKATRVAVVLFEQELHEEIDTAAWGKVPGGASA